MKKILLGVLILLLLTAVVTGGYAWNALNSPFKAFDKPVLLQIERGSGTREIARQLTEAGVLDQEWPFLLARALHRDATLQAGEYQFTEAASPADILGRLERGDIYYFDVTIPEGANIWEIARSLEMQGYFKEADFLAAAADPSPIRDLAPEAESLEGYLFPSTYRISHATTVVDLVRMMVDEFRHRWQQIQQEAPQGERMDLNQTLTLASLVEKETGVPEERRLVAGVFANRLERGMTLACDPTVIYAARLVGRWRGTIYQSDLDRDHPYNTYRNTGLPPGPIANPGAEAIAAAMNPAETDYLFFVAKGSGPGHVFTATNAEHNRAVQAYRRAVASQ